MFKNRNKNIQNANVNAHNSNNNEHNNVTTLKIHKNQEKSQVRMDLDIHT